MPMDITFITYFLPLFAFLLVFVIIYALLSKTEVLGESKFVHILVSFIIAIIFISVSSIRQYVTSVVPWFSVLIVAIFFILLIVGFSQKDFTIIKPWFTWVFVILLIIVFLVAAVKVFNKQLGPYLPESDEEPDSSFGLRLKNFLYSQEFLGTLLLLVIAVIVSWVITKEGK